MDINDLKQENSKWVAEEILEELKEYEDSGASISDGFAFYLEADEETVLARGNVSPAMLINIMTASFKTLQEESPGTAWLAETILKGIFSQKKDAD
ncbi:MAG: hypothetical protein ACLT3C_00770 [Peptococcus niger]